MRLDGGVVIEYAGVSKKEDDSSAMTWTVAS